MPVNAYTKTIEIKGDFEKKHAEILRGGEPPPKRLRQEEKGWRHHSSKAMSHEDALSSLMRNDLPPPRYMAGQSIQYYWASWMDGAKEVPLSIKKSSRGSWYVGEIINPPTWETVAYGGKTSTSWTYVAH